MAGVEVFSKFWGDYKSSLESLNISCTSPVAVVQQNIFGRKGFARSRTNSSVSSFRPCRHSCSLIHRLIFLKPSRSESSEPAEGFRKVFQCRHGADLTRFSQSINSVQGRCNAYFNLWCGSLKLYSPNAGVHLGFGMCGARGSHDANWSAFHTWIYTDIRHLPWI